MAAAIGLRWHGLVELRASLQTYAPDVTDASSPIVREAAEGAEAEMRARYPRRTGRLANSLVLTVQARGRTAVDYRLQNVAPYAAYFEYGTRYAPPGRVFVPIRNAAQRAMYARLKGETLPAFNLRPHGDAVE